MKITIISINYNNSIGLIRTIESVLAQTFSEVEYIIIDGGSTDGSFETIKRFEEKIDYWLSEEDKGVYDAMNKGVLKANGDYLLFLNSGDYFSSQNSLEFLVKGAQEDIVYGDLIMKNGSSTWIKRHPSFLSFGYFLKNSLSHPATLIKRRLFEEIGLYSERNKIVSDWEFFMFAICKHNATYRHVPIPVTIFNQDGMSSSNEYEELIYTERQKVLSLQYSAFLPDYEELDRCRTKINDFMNSRAHRWINKILTSALYRKVRR